jgi:hypothetical protein
MTLKSKTLRGPLCMAFAACVTASALFGSAACAGVQTTAGSNAKAVERQPQPTPARITPADLSKLRWIEGSWRGTGDVEKPFFERYRLEGDTALVVEGFDDETLAKVSDSTRFELKDGEFGGGNEGSRWAASELNDASVTFVPVRGARNTFRWQKEPDGNWKAILDWPAAGDKPARRRVYKMERWPPQK